VRVQNAPLRALRLELHKVVPIVKGEKALPAVRSGSLRIGKFLWVTGIGTPLSGNYCPTFQ